jgi:ligand-binding sensor domain-containing protein/signal transduction histidine kinase
MSSRSYSIKPCLKILILFLINLLFSQLILALDPTKPVFQYNHTAWFTKNGLPPYSITSITQTKNGYMWIGTKKGLVRFDGVRFTIFDSTNTDRFIGDNINTLLPNPDSSLWIGTNDGLFLFKERIIKAYTTSDGLSSNKINSLYRSRNGNIWVAAFRGGIDLFNGTEFKNQAKLPENAIRSIYEDSKGNLWIGTWGNEGACKLTNGSVTCYKTEDGLPDNHINSITEDKNGTIWIGTRDGLSYIKDDGNFITLTTKEGLSNNHIRSLYTDQHGNIWVGTLEGINRINKEGISFFRKEEGLSSDNITTIFEDLDRTIWIGTKNGLNQLRDSIFTIYDTKQGLSSNAISSISQDQNGDIWLTTYGGGMNQITEAGVVTYNKRKGLSNDYLGALYISKDGSVWCGTGDYSLCRIKEGTIKCYKFQDDFVTTIYEDEKGLIIGLSNKGLMRFKDGQITPFLMANGEELKIGGIKDRGGISWIRKDSKGALLVVTAGGLVKISKDKYTLYTKDNGLPEGKLYSTYEDASGNIWIATSKGLVLMRGENWSTFPTEKELFNNAIYSILEDDREALWIYGRTGVFSVSKQDLIKYADKQINKIGSMVHGLFDEFGSLESTTPIWSQPLKAKDGRLWFPTASGALVIDTGTIKTNQSPPKVLIEEILANHKPISTDGNISLSPGVERIEFRYTGFNYRAPEKIVFKYMLEGFDREWMEAGNKREISYTNIPPGQYRFRVIAANSEGLWNESGDSVDIYLQPFFYQTYWFLILSIISIISILCLLYYLRLRRIRYEFTLVLEERNRIAREVHDTLIQGMVGISTQLDVVSILLFKSPNSAKQQLDKLRILVRKSLDEARRSVWNIRNPEINQMNLVNILSNYTKELTSQYSVDIQFQVHGEYRHIPEKIESNIIQIGKEAVTNSVKHANAKLIIVDLNFTSQHIRLCVQDDGCGFDLNKGTALTNHFGLVGIKERAKQIEGQLAINSAVGRGTEVSLVVSLRDISLS